MLQGVWEQIQTLLGLERDVADVGALLMALRTIIIYVLTLALVRLGSRRLMGRASAFDFIIGILLGSVMSRAISGSAPFFPTLLAGATLIGMHWLFAAIAFRTNWFGPLVKGDRILLIKDGNVQREGMRQANITPNDLTEATRLQTGQRDPSKIRLAYLERNGSISVIPYKEPRVIDVSVADGVQTVRIEIE
jgi:uncharacterized membrane protein YcaP (DUF421 family)